MSSTTQRAESDRAAVSDASRGNIPGQPSLQQASTSSSLGTSSPLLAAQSPGEGLLHQASTEDIKDAILKIRQTAEFGSEAKTGFDSLDRIALLTTHLVLHRDMRKNPFVYESLMDAMAHPRGSAKVIARLLKDYMAMDLPLTASFCRQALRALAVHPNYSTQLRVLELMRENWLPIETGDVQNVIMGMARDGQHELAYLRFMDLIQAKQEPDIWVFDILISVLGKQRSHDEMVEIFKLRSERMNQDTAYSNVVYQVLESCSAGFHYEGTALAWEIGVTGDLFNPPDGMMDNILTTASLAGDTKLATAAYRKLTGRTKLRPPQHLELLDAYCKAGDTAGAIRVVSMLESFLAPYRELEVINSYLRNSTDESVWVEAEETARALAKEGKPAASAFRAVILALAGCHNVPKAAALADEMPALCGGEGAGDRVWRVILKYERDLDQRRAYARKYRDMFPEGSETRNHPWTYPGLVKACVEMGDMDLALRFMVQFVDMSSFNNFKKSRWFLELFDAALEARDDRIWTIYDAIVTKGPRPIAEWAWDFLKWRRSRGKDAEGLDGFIAEQTAMGRESGGSEEEE
ncbi:pentatricopeptide repeat protein [Sarocladium implicatum]|nr:pentatricopeptide repeat protein [Sarocladium implicatum]